MESINCTQGCCKLYYINKVCNNTSTSNQVAFFEKRKAGVFVVCQDNILLTQSYNNFWGIPKGRIELCDQDIRSCAERELKEETGLEVKLSESDLYSVIMDNCYIYKVEISSKDMVDISKLHVLDSTGIGWIKQSCALNLSNRFAKENIRLNVLTKQFLNSYFFSK